MDLSTPYPDTGLATRYPAYRAYKVIQSRGENMGIEKARVDHPPLEVSASDRLFPVISLFQCPSSKNIKFFTMRSADYRDKSTCRLCGFGPLKDVLQLTQTPLANAFVPPAMRDNEQRLFPLVLRMCARCHHVQLGCVVNPENLFRDYVYVSGTSPSFRRHFETYAEDVINRTGLQPDDLVLEIGSNDGTLLSVFKAHGARVLGIDPAAEIADRANKDGIPTIPEFFTSELANEISDQHGKAKIVTANNVFAHIDDLAEVVDGIQKVLSADGLFVFEVSYLVDVLTKNLFDTIYHEHLDYHSLGPLLEFFRKRNLKIIGAERISSHGGSIRVYVSHAGADWVEKPEVREFLQLEQEIGLNYFKTFIGFESRINELGTRVSNLVQDLKKDGFTIAGYGAPAKATTLLYHFRLTNALDFIVDDSPLKQGLFTPGSHIPVLSSQALKSRRPDYLIILAWNFADEIIARNQDYLSAGGRFIVPVPKLVVHGD
jgi:SAM-dependent methyltransferase